MVVPGRGKWVPIPPSGRTSACLLGGALAGKVKGMVPAENRSSHGGILVVADHTKVVRPTRPDKPQDLGSIPGSPTPSGF
jgi:hypothetical protein